MINNSIENKKLHTISIYVSNKPGVLVRVAQVFARRGFNIDSLVVSSGQEGKFSRITVTAKGDKKDLDQIILQLQKLIDVQKAVEHYSSDTIHKELALIKIAVDSEKRADVLQIINHFKAETLDLSEKSLVIQCTGSTDKLNALTEMLQKYEILEIVRTGKVLMARGNDVT